MARVLILDGDITIYTTETSLLLSLLEAKRLMEDLNKAIKKVESHESTSYR